MTTRETGPEPGVENLQDTSPGPRVIAIGSGKGGVGKSVLSVMTAAATVRRGRRVLLVDGSLNQANLHLLLGVRPRTSLDALLTGEAEPRELVVGIEPGFDLLPGDSGTEAIYRMSPTDRARLALRTTVLFDDYDTVLIDAGAGIENGIRATMRASRMLVVTTPEPASMSDAYALIKIVTLQVPTLAVDLLVNRAYEAAEAEEARERLSIASRRFLRRELPYAGAVFEDPGLRGRVRRPDQLLGTIPDEIHLLAERLDRPCGGAA
jgi:flagellar biosynthesis protein FlhG